MSVRTGREWGHVPKVRVPILKRRRLIVWGACLLLSLTLLWLAIPVVRFTDPVSPVLFGAGGELLGARPAADGQWRFPPGEKVPERFYDVLVRFEDKRFFAHPGVDPLALARAVRQNLRSRKVESGASTITMQVVRLARKNRPRTYLEKFKEAVLALRLETRRSKPEILALFAAHAPFGGNVVGIDAASWLYFGRSPERLSWAEAAFLAVLPNDPGLLASAEGRARLLGKRDRLLRRLEARGSCRSSSAVWPEPSGCPTGSGPCRARRPTSSTRWPKGRGRRRRSALSSTPGCRGRSGASPNSTGRASASGTSGTWRRSSSTTARPRSSPTSGTSVWSGGRSKGKTSTSS
ncbi:MAG: transglycosylase domain-containing protein [Ignavibacteriales bacterium]|nr:transglycosylase domain-containing protein [Ignavibacteriales bacterium]